MHDFAFERIIPVLARDDDDDDDDGNENKTIFYLVSC